MVVCSRCGGLYRSVESLRTHMESEHGLAKKLESPILNSIPESFKAKARKLIDHMQEHPDVFQWDNDGRIIINGSAIPDTNVVQLIRHFVSRKVGNPKGMKEFVQLLNKTNIPKTAVGQGRKHQRWVRYEDADDELRERKFVKNVKVSEQDHIDFL